MKKIFSIIAGMLIFVMASAQTVESSKFFENTYITVMGGGTTTVPYGNVVTPFFWDGAKQTVESVRPVAGLELGKYFTPVVGVSLEGLTFFNTTYSTTVVDELNVLGNAKVNLSNWFGGYKGYPRRVEVVVDGGLGWGHDFMGVDQTYNSPAANAETYDDQLTMTDPNYVVYKTGFELNFNLGKARAWQINVRPSVLWVNKDNLPGFDWNTDARVNCLAGLTYKFGSKSKKSHNFVLCPYSVTQAEYDAALAKIAELEARGPVEKEVVVEKVVEKTVEKVVEKNDEILPYFVIFARNSAELTRNEKLRLDQYFDGVSDETVVNIVGSADSGTGTRDYNASLAQRRADVVKSYILSRHNVKANVSTKLDSGNTPETSRSAVVTLEFVDAD